MRSLVARILLLCAGCFFGGASGVAAERPLLLPAEVSLRRGPVAITGTADANRLMVCNRTSATLSLVDVAARRIVSEWQVGGEPADLVWLGNSVWAWADFANAEVVVVRLSADQVEVLSTNSVPAWPIRLTVDASGAQLAVSSLWSRQVTLFAVNGEDHSLNRTSTSRLSFCPQEVRFSPNGDLLAVADAFAGALWILDARTGTAQVQGQLDAHQIGDVQWIGERELLTSHQILNADVPTTADNIAAGLLIENVIEPIQIESDTATWRLRSQGVHELGVPSHGAADPSGLAQDSDGNWWVAFAGTGELARLNGDYSVRERQAVGQTPQQVFFHRPSGQMVTINRLEDSLSLVDATTGSETTTLRLGPFPKLTAAERGEALFFDASLSRFGWMSCQSCHVHGHTNGGLADTFADGDAGAPKRVLSLLGGRDNSPWGWNGTFATLHDQVFKSGKDTMHGPGLNAREVLDVVAYLHTLPFPPPYAPATDAADEALVEQGRALFHRLECTRCHVPPLTFTSNQAYDVGFRDEQGRTCFNPPTLRGVGYRSRLFHDGRAESLEDVIVEYGHQINDALTDDDVAALTRYLESL